VTRGVLETLAEGRRREKGQTLFYRMLAGLAEAVGDAELAERMNDLHADEQHHLSRLTARILELGGMLEELEPESPERPELQAWEGVARTREEEEVRWYQEALEDPMDPDTEALLREILESERHHAEKLGGKWMSA
jgi:rubrerythrin